MAPQAKKAKTNGGSREVNQQALGKFFGAKPKELGQQPSTSDAAAPAASAVPAPAAASPVAPPAGGAAKTLSQEQLNRIEENKRRALERQRLKRGAEMEATDKPNDESPDSSTSAVAPTAAAKPPASPPKKEAVSAPMKPTPSPSKKAVENVTPVKCETSASARSQAITPKAPAAIANNATARVEGAVLASRQTLPIDGKDDQFHGTGKAPWMQYNNVYNMRLEGLRGRVLEQAKDLWSSKLAPDCFVGEVAGHVRGKGQEVVVVGIIFKDMPSRPNVIDQFRKHESRDQNTEERTKSLCSDSDTLWVEDGVMRLRLDVAQDVIAGMCTGLVAAVRGSVTEKGHFAVSAWCLAKSPRAPALPAATPAAAQHFVALVSGFCFGAADKATLDLAEEFLAGRSLDPQLKALGASVQRLIVCGGVVAPEELLMQNAEAVNEESPATRSRRLRAAALLEADDFFAKLAAVMPVQVMPGRDDPSNISLPQEPMHPFLFKQVRDCKDFKAVRNPFAASIGGLQILGHSGQPVHDMLRCARDMTPLKALKLSLEAAVLAPTAPDTLAAQPFQDKDPFVMKEVPHLLFSGGHDCADNAWVPSPSSEGASETGTQCVCVPAFHRQPAVVLVNLRDPRDVRVQTFGAAGDAHQTEAS